ncbi:MAG: hypothetical protein V4543_00645 [Bacteroidota bacterium]
MKAGIENYTELSARYGVPPALKSIHADFILPVMQNSWRAYRLAPEITESVDLYFDAFSKAAEQKKVKPAIKTQALKPVQKVAEIHTDIKFIRRFLSIVNRPVKHEAVTALLRAMQRAITKCELRKSGKFSAEIEKIQAELVRVANGKAQNVHIHLPEADLAKLIEIAGGEKIFPSVRLLQRYISLQGKAANKTAVQNLHSAVAKALNDKNSIADSDPLRGKIIELEKSLAVLLKTDNAKLKVTIGKQDLRGLAKLKESKPHSGKPGALAGLPAEPATVMSASDIMKISYSRLGLTGKWKEFLGDPAKGFTMMAYGKPGQGKSTFSMMLAKLLAENFGKTLYVSAEEYGSYTLQEKIERIGGGVPNLDFTARLADVSLSGYKFLFIDSVQIAGLTLESFRQLKRENPGLCIGLVFQSTKDGNYKGAQEWAHDVDIEVEVNGGIAKTNKNRYNQLTEMVVFKPDGSK